MAVEATVDLRGAGAVLQDEVAIPEDAGVARPGRELWGWRLRGWG